MDLGSIMLILALALGVGIYISLPLTRHSAAEKLVSSNKSIDDVDHKRSALLAERDRVLTALQELDFDQALGKIPAEDYPEQRTALMTSGAAVLLQLKTGSKWLWRNATAKFAVPPAMATMTWKWLSRHAAVTARKRLPDFAPSAARLS